MLVKVFATGKNSAKHPINYLLSKTDSKGKLREPPPVLLRGDTEITSRLIDSLDFEYKYSSGVLSFAPEDQPNLEKLHELIDSFEEHAFAGLERDRYSSLWVLHRHTENKRIELHFLFPRVELETGLSLNAFPPGHKSYFDPWRDYWNLKENWASPDEPERARSLQPQFSAFLKGKKEVPAKDKEEIHEYLMECIKAGNVQDRKDIVSILKEDLGLEINRLGKDYLSIKDPETDKKIRFKGHIYHESWRVTETNSSEKSRTSSGNGSDKARILDELETRFREKSERRAQFNQSYYQRKDREDQTDIDGGERSGGTATVATHQGKKNFVMGSNNNNFAPMRDDDRANLATSSNSTDDTNYTIIELISKAKQKVKELNHEGNRQYFDRSAHKIISTIRSANEAVSRTSQFFEESKRNLDTTITNTNETISATNRSVEAAIRNANEAFSATKRSATDTSQQLDYGIEQLKRIRQNIERLSERVENEKKRKQKNQSIVNPPELSNILDKEHLELLKEIRSQPQSKKEKKSQLEL